MVDCKINQSDRKISQDLNVQQLRLKLRLLDLGPPSWGKLIRRNISEANQLSREAFRLVSLDLCSKKLYKHYIVQCLSNISAQYAASAEVDSLLLKLLTREELLYIQDSFNATMKQKQFSYSPRFFSSIAIKMTMPLTIPGLVKESRMHWIKFACLNEF